MIWSVIDISNLVYEFIHRLMKFTIKIETKESIIIVRGSTVKKRQ